EDFAAHINGDFSGKVAIGDGGGDFGDISDLGGEVAGHGVDGVGEILPHAGDAFDFGLAAELAFGADFAGDTSHFGGEGVELRHHGVDDSGGMQELALERAAVHFEGHGLGEIAFGDSTDDARDFGGGLNQISDQAVDGIETLGPS